MLWHVNRPNVYIRTAGGSQLPIVLPGDIDYLSGLIELVQRLPLDGVGVPDEDVGLVTAGGDEGIGLVPVRADERVVGSEEALEFSLHVPDPGDVVICAGEESIT